MARGYFEECHNCKPPKRYPGCQDHCPSYAEAKAKHEADKEKERQRLRLEADIYGQKDKGVTRALKKHRKRKAPRYE